jgi:hypothetical protein
VLESGAATVDWVDATAVEGARAAIGLCTRWDSKATSPAPSLLPLPLNTIENNPRSSVGGDSTTQSSGWESIAWSEKKIPESLDGEGGSENKTLGEISSAYRNTPVMSSPPGWNLDMQETKGDYVSRRLSELSREIKKEIFQMDAGNFPALSVASNPIWETYFKLKLMLGQEKISQLLPEFEEYCDRVDRGPALGLQGRVLASQEASRALARPCIQHSFSKITNPTSAFNEHPPVQSSHLTAAMTNGGKGGENNDDNAGGMKEEEIEERKRGGVGSWKGK